ncbi:MAG: hypothetical protein Q4A65_00655 [Bacillota bacterium]|nr:hypothetical protein [Bacillota bacterium]
MKRISRSKISSKLIPLLVVILAAAMPAGAMATNLLGNAGSKAWDGSVDISWYTESDPEETTDYYIENAAQLAGLAYIVNGQLDAEVFPVQYKKNPEGTGDYDKASIKDYTNSAEGAYKEYYKMNTEHKGSYDIDYEAMLQTARAGEDPKLIDGTEDDGTTASGLTASDFYIQKFTHINSSGGGSGVTDTYYYIGNQKYDFLGKTVHLTADIDLGAGADADGQISGPNWTPIGGRFPADAYLLYTDNKGTEHHHQNLVVDSAFNGVFDGGCHTISNIYCDRWASDGDFLKNHGSGFIGNIGSLYDTKYDDVDTGYGHADNAEELPDGWIPAVRNLAVGNDATDETFKGYIKGNRMVGAVVGCMGDAENGVDIENCVNYASVFTTDSKGLAGIAGGSSGAGNIRNCYNAGTIRTTYSTSPAGGIIGSNDGTNVYNCYNIGRIINTEKDEYSEGIGSHYGGKYIIDNCYSLSGTFQHTSDSRAEEACDGYYRGSGYGSIVVNAFVRQGSDSEAGNGLKSEAFLDEMNAGAGNIFVRDSEGINNGYPILFWQAGNTGTGTVTAAATEKGAVIIRIPGGQTLEAGQSAQVPVGTTVILTNQAEPPNVLENYKADGRALRADYYTVTEDGQETVLGGDFMTLKSGVIHFDKDADIYQMGISKNGNAVIGEGNETRVVAVSDYIVADGDTIFQNDALTAKAVLKKGVELKDPDRAYNGRFKYDFTYSSGDTISTNAGIHTVTSDINEALTVKPQPLTAGKNWSDYADTSWCEKGEIHGDYTITTARQLAGLQQLVSEGYSFEGATVKLGNSISLKNADGTAGIRYWQPIGLSTKKFKGTFDGNGKSISGLTVSATSGAGGLFGHCEGAVIKGLTVYGNVQTPGNTAGIAAVMNGGSIENCINYAVVTSTAGTGKTGGICAEITDGARIINCRNKAKITSTTGVGGIVGNAADTAGGVIMCANYGAVSGTATGASTYTGGIAGQLGCAADRCGNYGKVTSLNSNVGGIAGYTFANEKADSKTKGHSDIKDCINQAAVKTTNTGASAVAGGIVGYGKYITMSNCYNSAAVSGKDYTGKLIGRFYKSIYNEVDKVYCTSGGKSVALDGSAKNVTKDPEVDYVKVTTKTAKKMKAKAFATLLNKNSKGTFKYVKKNYPQLKWVTVLKELKVTYKGAYKGTDKTYYGGSVNLPQPPKGYTYRFNKKKATGALWDGTIIKANVTVYVTKKKISKASVIFKAGGSEVYTMPFSSADKYLSEVPPAAETLEGVHRDGYTAKWSADDMKDENGVSYWDSSRTAALGTSDITVNAVYTQQTLEFTKNDDGDRVRFTADIDADYVNEHGQYLFLAPQAKGTIYVRNGADVTLDGTNGPFKEIRIVVEAGAGLTLKDLDITSDPARVAGTDDTYAVLDISGGNSAADATTVRFSGYNNIASSNDGSNGPNNKNVYPAAAVSGYVTFDAAEKDTDTIHLKSDNGSPVINIEDGAELEVAGGIVEAYKLEKLGANGGMVYGTDFDYNTRKGSGDVKGNLTVSGGSLICVSESNHMFAACVGRYTQTGGSAMFFATEALSANGVNGTGRSNGAEYALYADEMDVTGGSLYAGVRTHQNNTKDPIWYYMNRDAINSAGDSDQSGDGFNETHFLYAVDTSDWNGTEKTVSVDGREVYSGKGNLVSYTIGDGDSFTVDSSKADNHIYLWLEKGTSHTVAVDGSVIAEGVNETTVPNVRMTAWKADDKVRVRLFDRSFALDREDAGEYQIMISLYDNQGNEISETSVEGALTDSSSVYDCEPENLTEAVYMEVSVCTRGEDPEALLDLAGFEIK